MPGAKLNDVFADVENFTIFHRIMGMSTLIYSRGKLRISRTRFVISLISTSSILLTNFYFANSSRKSLFFVTIWYYYSNTLNYIFVTLCIVVSWVQGNRNVALLNRTLFKVRAADSQLFCLGEILPPTKPSWVSILISVFIAAAFFLRILILPKFTDCIHLLMFYLPFFLITSIEDYIDRFGCLFRHRFSAIKQHLSRCLGLEAKKTATVLEKLVICYHHLSSSTEDIDECHSLHVLLLLASFFISSFSEIYAVCTIIGRNVPLPNKEITLTVKALWIIVVILMIWRICHQFSAITTEAKEFNTLLYKFMIDDKTLEISNNSKLRLHIAMNREVVFTACGLFNLDYTLLRSIIASSATYLVILLQFSEQQLYSDSAEVTPGDVGNVTTTAEPLFLTTV